MALFTVTAGRHAAAALMLTAMAVATVTAGAAGWVLAAVPASAAPRAAEPSPAAPSPASRPGRDPATVVVRETWVIDGRRRPDGRQDAGFAARLTLTPVLPAGTRPAWGQEFGGYFGGDRVRVGEDDVTIPHGCGLAAYPAISARTGFAPGRNSFLVTDTVVCDTRLTLVTKISDPLTGVKTVPLSSWTLFARTAAGHRLLFKGRAGVTGNVPAGTALLVTESRVTGYTQLAQGDRLSLPPGATGSWSCASSRPDGRAGLEDSAGAGGDGVIVVQPGQHVTCTATNLLKRAIPVGLRPRPAAACPPRPVAACPPRPVAACPPRPVAACPPRRGRQRRPQPGADRPPPLRLGRPGRDAHAPGGRDAGA